MSRPFLYPQLIVLLAVTCCTLETAVGEEKGVTETLDEPRFAQKPSTTASHAITETCAAFGSYLPGSNPKYCASSISQDEENRESDDTSERPNQQHSKDDELLRKVFELRNTIRVLSAAHNDLLFSMMQNESSWVRMWLQTLWNYPLRYGRDDDIRLFDMLKRLGSFNFTLKAEILSDCDRDNPLLRGNVQRYLLDLPRRTGSSSVFWSSFIREEEWNKWKTRFAQIKDVIKHLQLKNAPYEYKEAVVEKLDTLLEDFRNQMFRTQITWMYSKERSWLEQVIDASAAKISNVKKSGTERLQNMSKTVTDAFINKKMAVLQALAEKAMELDDFGRRSSKDIHLWAGVLQPFHITGNLNSENTGVDAFMISLSDKLAAHSRGIAFTMGGVFILIVIRIFEERLLNLIDNSGRNQRIQDGRRRSRVRVTPTNTRDDDNNNTTSGSVLPLQRRMRVQQQRYQARRRLSNPSAAQQEVVILDDENEAREERAGGSPETVISLNRPTNSTNRRRLRNLVSVSELGPIRRPTVAESLRVGNRRINVVYEGQPNDDNQDEDDEVIAIVQSAQESRQKNTQSVVTRKKTSRSESRKGIAESQKALDDSLQRVARTSRDKKGSLKDASNLSSLTDQTRVLRSNASTRTTEALANRHTTGNSSLPRRRSARVSTPHAKENKN